MRGQQIYTVIQAVHSLIYIVAKYHFFSVVKLKGIIKYLQKCEGCTHFCEILYVCVCVCVYIYIYIYIYILHTRNYNNNNKCTYLYVLLKVCLFIYFREAK